MSKVIIVMLVALIPVVSFSQEAKKPQETKKEVTQVRKNAAPSHSYWGVTVYGSANQFNGDLSKNLFFNDKWMFGAGAMLTKQFSRVIGLRLKFGWAPLSSKVVDKAIGIPNDYPAITTARFTSYVIEGDLHATINWVNWALGYKPERFFSSYIILGVGMDHTQGRKWNANDEIVGYLGYPTHVGYDNQGYGNNSGIGKWNLEFKALAGLGFDFNLSKHWSINPEFVWRWRDGDVLDLTNGGTAAVKQDMYSGVNLGLTYKFAYSGCSLKDMEKRYNEVKYETTPTVLTMKGDSIVVTVKGTFPPKYFCPTAAMYWEPVVTYQGGQYTLKPIQIIGEKVNGNGTMIHYKEGGSFTYTTVFPYKPEMANSMLVVAPTIYDAKNKMYTKKDEIKANARFVDLPSRDLAPGVVYTPARAQMDMLPLIADHGFVKEIIASKNAVIYFKVNKFDLDLKFGLNKTQPAQDALSLLNNFVKQGWKIKDITINGWASPEGEETFNAGLSENRAKTGNTYMISQFQNWVKDAEKANKDKKDVKTKVDAAGKDVNFVVQSHGPDWNGFIKSVQASNIKDKDKILNVVNSAGDSKKKEQEIRNMIVIYPEIEEQMLPPLRRAEITANLYEPIRSDEEISKLAASTPDQLKAEELLYAATLSTNADTKLAIYENAARVYPNNWKANNNAGAANITKGNLDKAGNYLTKAAAAAPNNGMVENNIGVVAAKLKDYKKAEVQFKKAQQLGENENYNLGVLAIVKGDYTKANSLLANSKCTYNLGLAQLVSGNTTAAEGTLACAPQNPDTYYLMAICGARTNNTKMLYDNLIKAVADPKLKEQARSDKEFINFVTSQDFKNIVK